MLERWSIRNKIEAQTRPTEWYEKPQFIENLVKSHRTPSFTEVETTGENGKKIIKDILVIPPEGVDTSQDTYDFLLPGEAWEYFSPSGESKGFAKLVEINPEVKRVLQHRRDHTIQELPTPSRVFARRRTVKMN